MLHNRCRIFKIDRGDEDDSDSEFSDNNHDDDDDDDAGNFEDGNGVDLPVTERARLANGRAERDNLIRQFF